MSIAEGTDTLTLTIKRGILKKSLGPILIRLTCTSDDVRGIAEITIIPEIPPRDGACEVIGGGNDFEQLDSILFACTEFVGKAPFLYSFRYVGLADGVDPSNLAEVNVCLKLSNRFHARSILR